MTAADTPTPEAEGDRDATVLLLRRIRSGDALAMGELLARDLAWIRAYVHRQLFGVVRDTHDTGDIVNDVVVQFLQNGPRFEITSIDSCRALLGTIVLNCLRKKARRARLLPAAAGASATVLDLDRGDRAGSPPDESAADEEREWIRLGMLLLPGPAQDLLQLRQWEQLSFAEIGGRLGLSEDAARMRHDRALVRLGEVVVHLRAGRVDKVLAGAGT